MASEPLPFAFYSFGSNGSGQLGIGHNLDVSVPKEVLFQTSPSAQELPLVRAGGNHTLLLFPSGALLWSGDNSSGACGPTGNSESIIPSFRPMSIANSSLEADGRKISLCGATWESSTIVTKDVSGKSSQVYTFGLGNKGELGLGELIFRTTSPQLIKDFPPAGTEVLDIASSVSHTVVVLSNGDVYGWGNGRKGQLGLPESIIHAPRKIEDIDFKVVRAVCGREFTYLLSGPNEGKHKVIGSNKWNVISDAPLEMRNWKDIGASWGSILVLQSNGKLLSWGRHDHGQLAPTGLPDLTEIAVGSEHVLACSSSGDVLAWGWGEHGNCGPDTTGGDVKDRFNIVASSQILNQVGSKVTKLGAGCATSWIWTESSQ